MATYKFSSAGEWLGKIIADCVNEDDMNGLAVIASALASRLTTDDIQDLFQDDMENDGFFDNLEIESEQAKAFLGSLAANSPDMTLDDAREALEEADPPDRETISEELERLSLVHGGGNTTVAEILEGP